MELATSEDLAPKVERVLERLAPAVRALAPDVPWHHIGATAIPGSLTKGDVDLVLRVPAERFPAIVELLRHRFAIKQPENWTSDFASFGDDNGYELPVGIQVVVMDTNQDFFLFLRDYFTLNPVALDRYNELKRSHVGGGPEAYWKAKDQFLSQILQTEWK
jgi:GrpB-like predicted nucleotidyltransferase (UPF0157 family)